MQLLLIDRCISRAMTVAGRVVFYPVHDACSRDLCFILEVCVPKVEQDRLYIIRMVGMMTPHAPTQFR